MNKFFVDCDPGVDDSIALLYLLRRKDVQLMGITTGFGNTTAAQGAENALRLIHLAGAKGDIPVAMGAEVPLSGIKEEPPAHIHGKNGVANVELPPCPCCVSDESAVDLLVRTVRENPGEITLITLGRFTNLALALEKEPRLPALVKRVVSMGGTVACPGNVSPVAEANIAGDAEAADRVFAAGFNLCMVGLDVTMKTRLTWQQLLDMEEFCTDRREKDIHAYMLKALSFYMDFNGERGLGVKQCPVHDPSAMLMALEPHLYLTRTMRARVECGGTYCRGQIITDARPEPIDAQPVQFALDVDAEAAVNTLLWGFFTR